MKGTNEKNLRPPFTSEEGRKYQLKSAESRKKNNVKRRLISEAVRTQLYALITNPRHLEMLNESGMPVGKKPTYLDLVVVSNIMNLANSPKIDDLLKLMQVVGEQPSGGEEATNADMLALAELINNPQPDRDITEYEEGVKPHE